MTAETGPATIPVIILCGGEGTRLGDTQGLPKPLVEIGDRPILWHVMSLYAAHGFTDFVLCLGYRGAVIKDYFVGEELRRRDFRLVLGTSESPQFLDSPPSARWNVSFVNTGTEAMTGARLKRVERYVDAQHLMVTYADGLADIDITRLIRFHLAHGRVGTVTGVSPPSPFGELGVEGDRVARFAEKPQERALINGGFFVFRREFFAYLDDDDGCVLERSPLERLANDGQLHVYRHPGFWQCMDTQKDLRVLNEAWHSGHPPWRRCQ